MRFEIGRFLSAFCGYYAVEVLDTKVSHGEGFLVCRGGTHQFRLPAAQGHDHPVIHLPRDPRRSREGERRAWTVVGQLCTPKDVLSRQQALQGVEVGDLLVLPLAGAMATTSLTRISCATHVPIRSSSPQAARAVSPRRGSTARRAGELTERVAVPFIRF